MSHHPRRITALTQAWSAGRHAVVALAVVLLPGSSVAQSYGNLTARQAVAVAPWSFWWVAMTVIALGVYPLVLFALQAQMPRHARRGAPWVVGQALLQWLAGALCLVAMLAVSLFGSTLPPFLFVLAWIAGMILTTTITLPRRQH
jgi:hypothetical protein